MPTPPPGVPATTFAWKNPSNQIMYDDYNHEPFPVGDPSKRAFTYFVLTGGRFVYAAAIRLAVLKFVLSMSVRGCHGKWNKLSLCVFLLLHCNTPPPKATRDVLALASLEVELGNIEVGQNVTVKWRGKPVFIRRRSDDEIAKAADVNVATLRDPQPDSARVVKPEVCCEREAA